MQSLPAAAPPPQPKEGQWTTASLNRSLGRFGGGGIQSGDQNPPLLPGTGGGSGDISFWAVLGSAPGGEGQPGRTGSLRERPWESPSCQ